MWVSSRLLLVSLSLLLLLIMAHTFPGRSPLAEAVFADLVKKGGHSDKFNVIDSCGTGEDLFARTRRCCRLILCGVSGAYHEGDSPDDRTIAICRRNGVPISGSARKVRMEDFSKFDYIFGMEWVQVLVQ